MFKRNMQRLQQSARPTLVQEAAGLHVGISTDLHGAARHAAAVFRRHYRQWLRYGRHTAWGQYKRRFFTVAVGGGNTIKAQYAAMAQHHHSDIDWLGHVRFFFLEESTGEDNWESPETALLINFIVPLAHRLVERRGQRVLAHDLGLPPSADEDDIIDAMVATLLNPMNLAPVKQALDDGRRARALALARTEAARYADDLRKKLGQPMALHFIISGIGKDGTLGAFAPYSRELRDKNPSAIVVKQSTGAIRVALNRGVITAAGGISLIVSGSLKLRALGRFEMEEAGDFEQTVQETPLRMLRQSRAIAEKVYVFADEQSLHFDATLFEYRENGHTRQNRAETRAGEEDGGIHILLMHGFMGLFSFTSFLVRLPSAWTVSALHRGAHAKSLGEDEIFPHYARVLRKAMLRIWRQGQPVPIAGHSIAGVIIDHLLLSLIGDRSADITPYDKLGPENKQLVDALRAGGIIQLATWAPSDAAHTGQNVRSLIAHYRQHTALNYQGFEQTYERLRGDGLRPRPETAVGARDSLARLSRFLNAAGSRLLVNAYNTLIRALLNNRRVQQRMLNTDTPYVLRLVGNRLLKTASFYGLLKEVNAALHDPAEYQQRHLRALDIILAYDIPLLSIVHEDDFLVSAGRHREEHSYLLTQRKKKEGVKREQDLDIPARLLLLRRTQQDLPVDPLNPHLMIMSTSSEGNTIARQITAAITRFVNENAARAIAARQLKPLASVTKWRREHPTRQARGGREVA